MSNRIKGNRKHLTLADRIIIEKGLLYGDSFTAIAAAVGKDISTISKEVRKHSQITERKNKDFAPIPCANREHCSIFGLCRDNCSILCRMCRKTGQRCVDICPDYLPKTCVHLTKAPYVCNGCGKRINCLMEERIYSSKYADDCYRATLSGSREGINQTPESIQKMNDILTPLIAKGQSIAHIYATHANELNCSKRTVYEYIDAGIFDIKNIDLRRKVKYKKRKKSTEPSLNNRGYRVGRTYKDFQALLENGYNGNIVEMDTVEGKRGTKTCLMTMLFRNCNLMLVFRLQSQTQSEVKRVFDYLLAGLGSQLFSTLFEVILTDNGAEFQNPDKLEVTDEGEKVTKIYYCDPYRSNQKGALEKNHEYIRYVCPKGSSFTALTDEKVLLMANHINSEKRDSLNGHSPFQLSLLLLDNRLHDILGLMEIKPDEVNLTPDLFK